MELIANAIIPVFLLIGMGYFLKKRKIIAAETENFINNLAYYLVLPAMIFISIYKSPFDKIFSIKMVLGCYAAAFAVFLIAIALSRFYLQRQRGAMVLTTFRTNIAYLGFPLILNAYGQLALAQCSVLTGFIAPFTITLSILYLNMEYRGNNKEKNKILYYVFSDPLVLSSIAGIIFSYFRISLPTFIINTIDMISSMGSPLMLIAVGSGLKFSTIKRDKSAIVISTFLKLIIMPLLTLLIFRCFMPLDSHMELIIAVMTFAFPSALSTYMMVKQYKSNAELCSSIIMFTTVLSIFSISFWIIVLTKV